MFKKSIILFVVLFYLFMGNNVFSSFSIPVENVFVDIDEDYEYLNELQTLYDKGMIKPDSEGKFNPRALLNRDEFVGILGEVTCEKCIQPYTSIELINKYEDKETFFDLTDKNKYFYCIADATQEGFVDGYLEGTICEDETFSESEKPFCPNNTIILEEAIAVILRTSGILTNEEAEKVRVDIFNGKITESLSDDVSPKNLDGSVYSFYPDFQKALEYEVIDVDTQGNVTSDYLVNIEAGKIRPKQAISKEMFLHIAYITLRANSCEEKEEKDLSIQIKVKDKTCTKSQISCSDSNLDDSLNTYDFVSEVYTLSEESISDPEGFIRRFYNYNTGEEYKIYGKYVDNFTFLNDGERQIFLRVIDNSGNTGEVYKTINIGDDSNSLSVSVETSTIYGNGPLLVDFEGEVHGGDGPYTYYRSFGDGNSSIGSNNENIYKSEGIYETVLTIKDSNGKIGTASVLIQVLGDEAIIYNEDNDIIIIDENVDEDTDDDGIIDIADLCPLIAGSDKNDGCPIESDLCEYESDCEDGYDCDSGGVCIPEEIVESCDYSGGDIILGNVICNSCPCNYLLDFKSVLRKCDVIFPAITSQDNSSIYSRGELYQIK